MSTDEPVEAVTVTFPTPSKRLVVLPWLVLGATLLLVLRSIGTLLAQVQLASGPSFGDLEAIASGPSFDFVGDTRELLGTWKQAALESDSAYYLIAWAARAYTIGDTIFIAVYTVLLVQLWRRVRTHLPANIEDSRATWTRLRQAAHRKYLPYLAIGGAAADVIENTLRLIMVERAIGQRSVPDVLIVFSWISTTAKFGLLVAFGVLVAVLLLDTGLLRQWLRRAGWALWRLRVAFAAATLYVLILLADATGQAVDLVRRWVDDASGILVGVFSILAALLLGLVIWIQARRVVLSDQHHDHTPKTIDVVRWQVALAGTAAVLAAIAWFLDWRELFAAAAIAAVLFGLGFLGRTQKAMAAAAANKRADDARAPGAAEDVLAARRMARLLAITAPVTLMMVMAVAFAPVLIVLPLSGEAGSGRFIVACCFVAVAVAGAPLSALGGWKLLRRWDGSVENVPASFEHKYTVGIVVTAIAVGLSITGAVTHVSAVGVCTVVATFLAAVMLILGEFQRWAETHTAPPGILILGMSRMPFAALTAITVVLASFWLSDGSAHAVHRQRELPTGLSRNGVTLEKAFGAWVAGNCAGSGHGGQRVPLILVAAPGGGVRAAYWTSSALSDLLGPTRADPVPGCPAAPADRIFAMGGASGGSLGVLAYTAGIDTPNRSATWYDDQLARPDFLTDPITWMLTTDLARAVVGYGGEDRAKRLEDSFSRNVPGLGDDFFAGSWGLDGHHPVMLITGTQVESGCRLNIGAVRLTDAASRARAGTDRTVCTSLGRGDAQDDAPVTTDVLDVLCGPEPGSDLLSLSRSTAALLSARFPYVSPSGQFYGCGDARRTAIVDGGYAENTGIGLLAALWPHLEPLIARHNATPGNATIIPVFAEVDNHYERVAASGVPARTVEGLVPPSTQARPDQLDDRAMEAMIAGLFTGAVPGTAASCDVASGEGRFVRINPRTSPGLPAPLAWTMSKLATDDLTAQRKIALDGPGPKALGVWATGTVVCAP
ncbi:hypothetical protein F4553_006089 [Allocatelliglobosispora scoriae]|uniref:PNPLA domain-containing protein n=1 Tax=Allocatelliglobosispora scoriae TaxID=643052 RepID=A0A841BYA9_9ACTN|nr:hypothetical protein [Allocatelliglobosispora scoriae]MBB5872655.1 hypothetical protein [Allocatelliglobosispora scoriae]